MSCSDITGFVGETRNAEGGTVEVIDVGYNSNNAMITVTTPWGSVESYEVITMNQTLTFIDDDESYAVTLTAIGYSSYRGAYFAKFHVCYEYNIAGLEVTALNLELPSPGTGQAIAYVTVTGYGSGFVRIDWGDGKDVTFSASAGTWEMTHLYEANGTYSVCAGVV